LLTFEIYPLFPPGNRFYTARFKNGGLYVPSGPVRTAIFPVAGLGTRFLPATKSVPKELLPVLDTPLIQFAIDEVREAGIERLVFVSHPSKTAIERYVLHDADLSTILRARGLHGVADRLDGAIPGSDGGGPVFAMQPEPLGLGHAVLCARPYILPGAVAVVLPDDLILSPRGCLAQMIEAYDTNPYGHLVATMDVPPDQVSAYGVLGILRHEGRLAIADRIVEKPMPLEAPSSTAVVGRYVLDSSIFDDLEQTQPGAGGEIQLTDAIAAGIDRIGLAGFRFDGARFDCGSREGMLAATLARAACEPALAALISRAGSLAAGRFAAE
jgi:UTP--glucose-1-phosphate uridylyltransferase